MPNQLLAGTTNVFRFPTETRQRPTVELLLQIAPDAREVLLAADAYRLEPAADDLRDCTDAETAEYIANHVTDMGRERRGQLDALLADSIDPAVKACRALATAQAAAAEARAAVEQAKAAGGTRLEPLQDRAAVLGQEAAEALLNAHARCEEAFGVARAVSIARTGEAWTPRDPDAEFEALMAMGARRRVG